MAFFISHSNRQYGLYIAATRLRHGFCAIRYSAKKTELLIREDGKPQSLRQRHARETSVPARAVFVDLRLRTKGRVYAAHEKGALTQFCTLDHPFAKLVPMFVSLTPIQKTNATKRTTKVYSTRPCPFSSLYSRLNNSILWSSCSDGLLFSRYRPAKTGALSQLIFLRNGIAIGVPEVISTKNHVFLVNTSHARAFTGLIWQFSDKVTCSRCHAGS